MSLARLQFHVLIPEFSGSLKLNSTVYCKLLLKLQLFSVNQVVSYIEIAISDVQFDPWKPGMVQLRFQVIAAGVYSISYFIIFLN